MFADRQCRQRVLLFVALFVITLGVLFFLFPPFYTFDSYDYLDLALHPRIGESHPLGFGLLLRLLFFIGHPFGIKPDRMLVIWNAFCVSAGLFFCLTQIGWRSLESVKTTPKAKLILQVMALAMLAVLVFPAWLFIGNSFWAECSVILQTLLFCWFLRKTEKLSLGAVVGIGAVLAIWCYQTKYSALVYFVAIMAVAVLPKLRLTRLKIERPLLKKLVLASVVCFAAIKLTNVVLTQFYPKTEGQLYGANFVLRNSMVCTLRCEADLYEKNCSTEEGRQLIENTPCNDIYWGKVSLGNPKLGFLSSPLANFKALGPYRSLKWFILAPFKYLQGIHATEMGLFSFGIDKGAVDAYPETTAYFKDRFPAREASPRFLALADDLNSLFTARVYHTLCAFLVLASLWLIFSTKQITTFFFAITCLGFYLLFAYLNHHVPFRYLIEVITPGVFAVFDAIGRRTNSTPDQMNEAA